MLSSVECWQGPKQITRWQESDSIFITRGQGKEQEEEEGRGTRMTMILERPKIVKNWGGTGRGSLEGVEDLA